MRITWWLGFVACAVVATPAFALDQVSREQDIIALRLGQRVQVDDGSCPTGQIKEIQGTTLTTGGVTRSRKCVPRMGTKTR
jgi:hypothetical protein